jgi:signal transduction histidine kinase
VQDLARVETSLNIIGADSISPEDRLASERLALLVEASRLATSQRDPIAAMRAILWRAVPILADCCSFDVIGPHGRRVRAWSTRGGGSARPGHPRLPPRAEGTEHPIGVIALAARTGRTQVELAVAPLREASRSVPPLLREPTSLVAVPMTRLEEGVGVLTFCFSESRRRHSTDDVLVAEELGRRISVAMENVRLRGRAREAAGAILRERERFEVLLREQEVLVEAGTLLASSFDYAVTLRRIVEMTVPRLADYCLIHIPDADGTLRRVAERYREPNQLAEFKAPLKLPPPSPIMRVLRTGASVWLPEVTDDDLISWSQSAEHLAALRGAGPKSLVCVPLITHGRLLGTMVFATNTSDRRYDEDAVSLAEQLAQRAAWALDTALLREAADEARRESEQARKDAEKAQSLKDVLLQILSRELGTPLAAVRLWESILDAARDDRSRAKALDAIRESATAQSRLVDDLLDVSACTVGTLKIARLPIDMGLLVSTAAELVRARVRERKVVSRSLVGEAPAFVMGDPFRLRQVIGILLSNALKFTGAGGEISVLTRRCPEGVDVVVSDNGRGIESDLLPDVFKPLSPPSPHSPSSPSSSLPHPAEIGGPEVGGVGLSLAIAQQLVHMHGGTIRVTSPGVGLGSTIVVTLPTLPAQSAAAETAHPPL